jgi:hypothetical protein
LNKYNDYIPLLNSFDGKFKSITSSSKITGKDKFEYNFLLICRYFESCQNQRTILSQLENSQVVKTLYFYTECNGKI